jgi:hypothetical protein
MGMGSCTSGGLCAPKHPLVEGASRALIGAPGPGPNARHLSLLICKMMEVWEVLRGKYDKIRILNEAPCGTGCYD